MSTNSNPGFCQKAIGTLAHAWPCGEEASYRVTLQDGGVLEACDEHMGGLIALMAEAGWEKP